MTTRASGWSSSRTRRTSPPCARRSSWPSRPRRPTSSSATQAVRAVFLIDPRATVRAILYYPLSNGRNIDEILRLLVALQTSDEHKIATPANWRVGEDVIIPPPGSTGLAAERVEKAGKDYQCLDWFLCLKKYPGK